MEIPPAFCHLSDLQYGFFFLLALNKNKIGSTQGCCCRWPVCIRVAESLLNPGSVGNLSQVKYEDRWGSALRLPCQPVLGMLALFSKDKPEIQVFILQALWSPGIIRRHTRNAEMGQLLWKSVCTLSSRNSSCLQDWQAFIHGRK